MSGGGGRYGILREAGMLAEWKHIRALPKFWASEDDLFVRFSTQTPLRYAVDQVDRRRGCQQSARNGNEPGTMSGP